MPFSRENHLCNCLATWGMRISCEWVGLRCQLKITKEYLISQQNSFFVAKSKNMTNSVVFTSALVSYLFSTADLTKRSRSAAPLLLDFLEAAWLVFLTDATLGEFLWKKASNSGKIIELNRKHEKPWTKTNPIPHYIVVFWLPGRALSIYTGNGWLNLIYWLHHVPCASFSDG